MKLTLLTLFMCATGLFASINSQTIRVNINANNTTTRTILNEIEKQTDYLFIYDTKEVNLDRKISVDANDKTVAEILSTIFNNTDVVYAMEGSNIMLMKKDSHAGVAQQKTRKVTGKIIDNKGDAIIGANVIVKGTTIGNITDMDGHFTLAVPERATLIVSYIGYVNAAIQVGTSSVIHVTLNEDTQKVGEVVVTALGIKREDKALGYAVQKVSAESFETVKSIDFSSALTGKVSGLNVKNSTEFNETPILELRGETTPPLLVVDGVPYGNVSLRDISADDVESVDILKGATASALYGARGGSGAIMVTTKKAKKDGLQVSMNSSTMFKAGFLKFPEVQTGYSSGRGGKYGAGDVVWGDKLDIGRTANMYNPETYQWEEMELTSKGKNNFKNFLQPSFVTNNNVSVSQKGKYGSFRTSLSHVYSEGQFVNTKLNKVTYSVNGEFNYKGFDFQGGITFNNHMYPNNMGTGNYSAGSYMYNLVVWMGAEYDVRDFRDYWIRPHEEQNWMDKVWYDNPWFAANENVHSDNYNLTNGYISTGYQIKDWLKISLRTGLDVYGGREEWQNPISSNGGSSKSGYYALSRRGGLSSNTDFLILANKTWGDWSIDGFLGGTIYYWKNDFIKGETQNGISIPGFYSLQASVDPVKMSSRVTSKQTNSLYGKLSASWKNTVYIDVTGRNDWSSTLPEETRSYFYPSIASSLIISEMIPKQDWLSLWKIRGSWTVTKTDLEVYDTNNAYTINSNIWDGLNGATYPTSIRGGNVLPQASRSFEIGTAAHFLDNRLWTDITYYNKLSYDFARKAEISAVSGFNSTLINIDEELMRKGVEITIGAKPIVTNDFTWNLLANWSLDRCTYHKTDPVYSIQRDWVKEGERWDWIDVNDWERDPNGHIIHENGFPVLSQYKSKLGHANPNWIWGLTNTLKYKNFTLNVSIDGRVGGIAYARTNQSLWNAGSHIESDNQWRYDEVVNGKKNYIGEGVMVISGSVDYDSDGRIIRDDRIFAPNNKEVSYEGYINQYHRWNGEANTQNYFKQTFLKLRELSVTYDLPKQLCKKIKMENASVSFIGNNLFVWTKEFKYADPDKGSEQLASPSIRMLGFNLKVNF